MLLSRVVRPIGQSTQGPAVVFWIYFTQDKIKYNFICSLRARFTLIGAIWFKLLTNRTGIVASKFGILSQNDCTIVEWARDAFGTTHWILIRREWTKSAVFLREIIVISHVTFLYGFDYILFYCYPTVAHARWWGLCQSTGCIIFIARSALSYGWPLSIRISRAIFAIRSIIPGTGGTVT